jgi:hypothetical protein
MIHFYVAEPFVFAFKIKSTRYVDLFVDDFDKAIRDRVLYMFHATLRIAHIREDGPPFTNGVRQLRIEICTPTHLRDPVLSPNRKQRLSQPSFVTVC